MKLPAARIDSFLRRPDDGVRAALFYGGDAGLVRERAAQLLRSVVGDGDDPFRTATFSAQEIGKDGARLADEMAAQSLLGGRRALRVRGAGDGLTAALKAALDQPGADNLAIIEADELAPRSSLRKLCETASDAVAIPCYPPDSDAIARLVRDLLAEAKIAIDRDAEDYLASALAGDRGLVRREVEKLIAYAGDRGRVDLAAAEASAGDSAERTLDDAVLAAADGNLRDADRALEKLFAEGMSPVAVLRAAQRHFGRLHLVASRVAAGDDPDTALSALRPPVFFRTKPRMRRQLDRWRHDRLADALERLVDTEAECKRTGMPANVLCSRALLQIANLARRR
ncbi:MAG: DNA polymerase III subunit delta [Inquilinus sp.]|nr:DNA polymerase III subunit delta [Inquilinus sp.]